MILSDALGDIVSALCPLSACYIIHVDGRYLLGITVFQLKHVSASAE